jgi:putative transposase
MINNGLFDDEFSQPLPKVEAKQSQNYSKDLQALPEKIQITTFARFKYIQWLEANIQGGWTQKNLEPLLKVMPEVEGEKKPSCRSAARWHSVYINADRNIMALVPNHQKKGNRELDITTDKFFEKALERYLVKEKPSVSSAYRYYVDLVIIENDSVINSSLKPLSYKAFKNRINNLPQYDVMFARYGKRLADIAFNKVEGHKRPTRVLEKVEIDHTPLDLILLDDELHIPLGRPTLTMLVDVYSHCIVGYYFSFSEPSYDAVRRAMLNAMKPKDEVAKLYPDTVNRWECAGKIETLVVDNGAEFWSNSLELACEEIGINTQYNPVAKPWLKPLVERMFGTINTVLLDPIPGKTFSNILQKYGYNPKKDAIMRFSSFMQLFHKWIVDVYHQDADSRFKYIPSQLWNQGFKGLPPTVLSKEDLEQLDVVLSISKHPTLRKGGIRLENLSYDSNELAYYRKQFSHKISHKVLIKLNPDDISYIYVYLVKLERYVRVSCIDPSGYTQNLSLNQHKINVRIHRDFISGSIDTVGLAKARMFIHEKIQNEFIELKNAPKNSKVKGGKALAKHQNVSSDSQKSITQTSPLVNKKATTKDQPTDNWDDFISDLDGF